MPDFSTATNLEEFEELLPASEGSSSHNFGVPEAAAVALERIEKSYKNKWNALLEDEAAKKAELKQARRALQEEEARVQQLADSEQAQLDIISEAQRRCEQAKAHLEKMENELRRVREAKDELERRVLSCQEAEVKAAEAAHTAEVEHLSAVDFQRTLEARQAELSDENMKAKRDTDSLLTEVEIAKTALEFITSDVASLELELKERKARLLELRKELGATEREEMEASALLASTMAKLQSARNTLQQLQSELAAIEAEMSQLEQQVLQLQTQKENTKDYSERVGRWWRRRTRHVSRQGERDALEAQIRERRTRIESLKVKRSDLMQRRNTTESQINTFEDRVDALNAKLIPTRARISELRMDVNATASDVLIAIAEVDEAKGKRLKAREDHISAQRTLAVAKGSMEEIAAKLSKNSALVISAKQASEAAEQKRVAAVGALESARQALQERQAEYDRIQRDVNAAGAKFNASDALLVESTKKHELLMKELQVGRNGLFTAQAKVDHLQAAVQQAGMECAQKLRDLRWIHDNRAASATMRASSSGKSVAPPVDVAYDSEEEEDLARHR
jgi:chromosome segregation ATPase